MKNEQQLILELSKPVNYDKNKISDLLSENPDLPYVLGHLLYNRTGGIAHTVLKKCGVEKINREFRNTLKIIFDSYSERSRSYRQMLGYISEILEPAESKYCLLKGAYLSDIYTDGCRISNDIDLLTEASNIDEIGKILTSNGFIQGSLVNDEIKPASRSEIISSRMGRGETVPFLKEIGLTGMKHLEIDINFSLDFKPLDNSDPVRMMVNNAITYTCKNGTKVKIPSKTDFIIHLCAHLYKEATTYPWVKMGRDLSLYKFCDLYLMLPMLSKEEADNAAEKIMEMDLRKECFYAIKNTMILFHLQNEPADSLLKKITPDDLGFMNSIVDPGAKKTYCFEEDFLSWFFCPDRAGRLKEI